MRCWPLSTSTTTSTPYGASSRPARAAPSTESTPIATVGPLGQVAQPVGRPLVDARAGRRRTGRRSRCRANTSASPSVATVSPTAPGRAGAGRSPATCGSSRAGAAPRRRSRPTRRPGVRCGAAGRGRRGGTASSARPSRSQLLVAVRVAAEQPAVRPGQRGDRRDLVVGELEAVEVEVLALPRRASPTSGSAGCRAGAASAGSTWPGGTPCASAAATTTRLRERRLPLAHRAPRLGHDAELVVDLAHLRLREVGVQLDLVEHRASRRSRR